MTPFRSRLKRAMEGILGSHLSLGIARRRQRGARLVLAYHNVVLNRPSPNPGEASLHLAFDGFRRQLDAIEVSGFDVVSLGSPEPDPDATPQVVITFDDAYFGSLELAVPELARRGLPATVFVAPGILGRSTMWWDSLADPQTLCVPPAMRRTALSEHAGDNERILRIADSEGWPRYATSSEHRIGTVAEVATALASHPRLTLGAHSWSHANLCELDAEQLARELTEPLKWLVATWGNRVVPWLAYPYGLTSPAVKRAAADHGYGGSLVVAGNWQRRGGDRHEVQRYNVTNGLSTAGFRARLAGYFLT